MNSEQWGAWAILELMGHRRIAGFVSEVELAGKGMLRIEIPTDPPATQFYSPESLYCLTPTTEELAKQLAESSAPKPVSRWELPPAKEPEDNEPPY
jgi:hypothetical protein